MAPIHDAVIDGDLQKVMRLVEEDPGVVSLTDPDEGKGGTALHFASKYGRIEIALYLLDQGADINARDIYHGTPLFYACENGFVEMVEMLVSRGADPTLRMVGVSCLYLAALFNHVEVVRYLLTIKAMRASAIVDAIGIQGPNPLWWAACKGHGKMVKVLLEAGANPMVVGEWIPIKIAQRRGHQECVEHLQVSGGVVIVSKGLASLPPTPSSSSCSSIYITHPVDPSIASVIYQTC